MSDRLGPLKSFVPSQTPALVVRRATLMRNLGAMQTAADAAGAALRAHGKMHKCSTLGRLQVEGGAVGLCCQTVGEAEAFAAAGISDLLITSPPAPWAAGRIAALAARGVKVGVVADDGGQIERLSQAATAAGTTIDVVVDIDLGLHRTGAAPGDAVGLAGKAQNSPGLRWRGVQAYAGDLQHLADLAVRKARVEAAQGVLAAVVADLKTAGLEPQVVTGAGTGTYALDLGSGAFNEIQAGSYAFMDVEYEDCGAPDGGPWPFEAALFLAAGVVSDRHKTHVTCDVGLKAHSVDGPAARVVGGAPEGSTWRAMGDEHGAVFHPEMMARLRALGREAVDAIGALDADPAMARPADLPKVGDIVWLQPGHCDPTVNLHDVLYVVDEDGSFEVWPIDARRVSPTAPRP